MADLTEPLPAVITVSDAAIEPHGERSVGERTASSGAEGTTMTEQLEIGEPSDVNDAADYESRYPTGAQHHGQRLCASNIFADHLRFTSREEVQTHRHLVSCSAALASRLPAHGETD